MTFKSIFSAICLTTALALPAAAENITAANPQSLMDFFASENATAKMTEDNVGDPKIDMKYYSTEFSVYFYGCDDGKSCDAIQFFSGYATKGEVAIAKINKWNTEQRFGRAYLTDEGAARVEYDIYTGADGITAEDFSEMFEIWTNLLGKFEKHIDW
ncbi:YbjN domain-containing protein [Aliiroseovarius crassostreae]|uniref:YbjN domain-containing protein n=1 Tax=Aliiroseovarius crassostreae TaxID=154981 RepID=UPI003C7AC3F9